MSLIEECTNDWVETFEKLENQSGSMWHMAAKGILPEGVNPKDPRVESLCHKATLELAARQEDRAALKRA